MNPKDIIPSEIVKDIYTDGVSPALKEFGKLSQDVMKTIRLLTIPIQYTSHIQDRLEKHLEKISKEVPEENRVLPSEPILIPILEKLKYYDSDNAKDEVVKMYQELLKKSFDKNTISVIHPSFIEIIGQLSPDEVSLLNQIRYGYKYYNIVFVYDDYDNKGKLYIKDDSFKRIVQTSYQHKKDTTFTDEKKRIIKHIEMISISFEDLINKKYAQVYLEHLEKLGLIENYQQYPNNEEYIIRVRCKRKKQILKPERFTCFEDINVKSKAYKLTEFGKLFHSVVSE